MEASKKEAINNEIGLIVKQLQSINIDKYGAANELQSISAQLISTSNKITEISMTNDVIH